MLECKYTKKDLQDALLKEYEHLIHDDYEEGDMTAEEYSEYLKALDITQLIDEVDVCDGYYELDHFMKHWGTNNA